MKNQTSRGFIKIAIILIAGLVLLKYVYDIDVLDRVYDAWLWVWNKYGDQIQNLWQWLKAKIQ